MREAGSGTRVTLTDYLAARQPPLSARIAMELGTSAAARSAIAAEVPGFGSTGPGPSPEVYLCDFELFPLELFSLLSRQPSITSFALHKPDMSLSRGANDLDGKHARNHRSMEEIQ
jgi:hypothetical protein